jgi:hypothetical protein
MSVRDHEMAKTTRGGATLYRSAPMNLRRLALATLMLASICAPAAQAAPDQASVMMDDDQLLYRNGVTQTRTLVTMRSLGADAVKATVLWRVVAEGADLTNAEIEKIKGEKNRDKARAQRKRFKANDPRTYPTRNWDRYDNLVKEATKLGMRVYFTLTGPGPRYGHRKAPPSQRANSGTFKPIPTRFRSFAEAVGKRYSGTYRDENGVRQPLPRVALWSIWNEPNQPGWLSPQWEGDVPTSPVLYRELYQAGYEGLVRSGHGEDAILIGETAPLGSETKGPRNGIKPVPFLRELVCLKADGTAYAGPEAAARKCDDFAKKGPLKAVGFAHHPYTKKGAPTVAPKTPDEITMGNIGSLGPFLDTIAAQSGGLIPGGLPIFLTEFGYESNPPDTRNGIPLLRQAQFNQLAEFLAYNDPRVLATTQFLVRDVGPVTKYPKGSRLYWFTYQSGLYTVGGRAKPAAFAYTLPLVVYVAGEGLTGFWGQLKFRPNGAPDNAYVYWQPQANNELCGTGSWVQLGGPNPTSFRGFFQGAVPTPGPGGQYCAGFFDDATQKFTHVSLSTKP